MGCDDRSELAGGQSAAALGDLVGQAGLVERAAVGERGVPVGELERRHQHVALPDREAGAVAAAPELVVGRGRVHLHPVLVVRDDAGLVAEPDAGRFAEPVGRGGVLDGVADGVLGVGELVAGEVAREARGLSLVAVAVPELVAHRVEVHVARHRERGSQRPGAEHVPPRVAAHLVVPEREAARRVLVVHVVGALGVEAALQHGQCRERLERRPRRVSVQRPVDQWVVRVVEVLVGVALRRSRWGRSSGSRPAPPPSQSRAFEHDDRAGVRRVVGAAVRVDQRPGTHHALRQGGLGDLLHVRGRR